MKTTKSTATRISRGMKRFRSCNGCILVPAVFYIIWGIIEITQIPIAD